MSVTKDGVALIAEERRRQIEVERFTADHDDEYIDGEMAGAAAAYAASAHRQIAEGIPASAVMQLQTWRWHHSRWKPKNPIRDLVRAGALIAAEIDRLQRLSSQ